MEGKGKGKKKEREKRKEKGKERRKERKGERKEKEKGKTTLCKFGSLMVFYFVFVFSPDLNYFIIPYPKLK